jgi:peptide methionine sulfoxide reductase msrA/msrB
VGRLYRQTARVVALGVVVLLSMSFFGCSSKGNEATSVSPIASLKPVGGKGVKTIYFAGGCFWGTEKYFDQIHGVTATEVGYANGASNSATYGDGSGYAETVKIEYDPSVAPLPFLLREFYKAIDPTTIDRQGNDVGTEYRSGIYYTVLSDRPIIEASLAQLQTQYSARIAIETGPLKTYTRAEDYHQKYLQKNPGGYCHIPLNLFQQATAAVPLPSDFPTASIGATTSAAPETQNDAD